MDARVAGCSASLVLRVAGAPEVRLDLAPGEGAVVCGPPGSGKSTVLRSLAGLDQVGLATGTVYLEASAYAPAGPPPPGVAWVTQDPYRTFLGSTVLDEVGGHGSALQGLDLDPGADPRSLSRGEAWRLALAAALAREPRLLLVDEASGSLDGPGLAWARQRLEAWLAAGGMLVAAEHRPEVLDGLGLHTVRLGPRRPLPAPRALPEPHGEPVVVARSLEAHPGGARAVGPVDLEVRPGERVGLSGANGCGKTTLLRCLAGLEPAAGGEVEVGGRVGLVVQDPDELLHRERVRDEVGTPVVPEVLELLGLDVDPEVDPLRLSHGQRQAVAVASVLASAPEVILLDEPTAWLDPAAEAAVFAALDVLQERGCAVVVASHDPELLARRCHRTVHLSPSRALPTRPRREPPARTDLGVVAVLVLGLVAILTVAFTRELPWLWAEVAVALVALRMSPRGRRSLPRVLRRGALLVLASTTVLSVLRGWPLGLELGLLTAGKALGAWLPAAIALRWLRRDDLERALVRGLGPRLGLAASLCVGAAPLLERVARRAFELARLRRQRSPMAVVVPVVLRILDLASAQADQVSLRSAE